MDEEDEKVIEKVLGTFVANGVEVKLMAYIFYPYLAWECDDATIAKILERSFYQGESSHPESLGYPYWWYGIEALKEAGIAVTNVKSPPREWLPDDQIGRDGNPVF